MERYNEGDDLAFRLLVGTASQLRLNTNNGVNYLQPSTFTST